MSAGTADAPESAPIIPRPRGQFAKGRSGNPGGRPRTQRAQPTASAFDIIIDKTLTITQGGISREVSVDEALQHKTYQDALAGSRLARREILKMIAKREKALAAMTPPRPLGTVSMEHFDPGNAVGALVLLGVAEHASDAQDRRLKLFPWAVQHALGRRGQPALSAPELTRIKECTLEEDKVRWPKP